MLRQVLTILYNSVNSAWVHSLIYSKFTWIHHIFIDVFCCFPPIITINCSFLSPHSLPYCPCKDLILEKVLSLSCYMFLPLYHLNFIDQYMWCIISYHKMCSPFMPYFPVALTSLSTPLLSRTLWKVGFHCYFYVIPTSPLNDSSANQPWPLSCYWRLPLFQGSFSVEIVSSPSFYFITLTCVFSHLTGHDCFINPCWLSLLCSPSFKSRSASGLRSWAPFSSMSTQSSKAICHTDSGTIKRLLPLNVSNSYLKTRNENANWEPITHYFK